MTNSEIISIIISKNPSNRISELRKVQILQLAARYGTADDIRAAYSAYGSFEFVSGALSYACEYADLSGIIWAQCFQAVKFHGRLITLIWE